MTGTHTVKTSQTWKQRLSGALGGVILGILLFVGSFFVLFLNEGRSVKTYRSLQEGAGEVISVQVAKVDPENEGKLVHLAGGLTAASPVQDSFFNMEEDALGLRRNVEMFQWLEESSSETRERLGGGEETVTSYTYRATWSSALIDSSRFHAAAEYQNPAGFSVDSREVLSQDARMGGYEIPESVLGQLGEWKLLSATAYHVPDRVITTDESARQWSMHDERLYLARGSGDSEIGDLRVNFEMLPEGDASVVGEQSGDTMARYQTRAGGSVFLVQSGIQDAEEMFQLAQASNRTLTWLLRGAGFLLMFMGMNLVAKPIEVAAAVVPFVGRIVGLGTGLAALAIAGALSMLTIGIAWLAYRPVLAILLLVGAGLVLALGFKLGIHKKIPGRANRY